MKVSWEFYFARKKIELVDFVKGKKSLAEVRAIFNNKNLTVPSDEIITQAFEYWDKKKQEQNKVPKKTTPRRVSKASKKPKKENENKSTEEKNNTSKKPENTDGKYFRKVIPKKKK